MAFTVQDNFIDVNIYDESIIVPSEPTLPRRITFLQAIFGSKGKSNRIIDFESSTSVKETFGQDIEDIEKYGQGGLNLIHAMQGGAAGQVCRLLPPDAQTASLLVSAILTTRTDLPVYDRNDDGNYKVDADGAKIPTIGETLTPNPDWDTWKTNYDLAESSGDWQGSNTEEAWLSSNTEPDKFLTTQGPVITEGVEVKIVTEVGAVANDTDSAVLDTGTGIKVPLFKFLYNGKGKFGSNVGIQILNDYLRDDETNDGRRYEIKWYLKDESGNAYAYGSPIYFAMNPKATITPSSTTFESITVVYPERDENGREREIYVKPFVEKNFEAILEYIAPFVEDDTPENIDIINCTDKSKIPYKNFLKSEDQDNVDFSKVVKFLIGGSDGSLQVGETIKDLNDQDYIVTAEFAEQVKKDLLKQFFRGQIDPRLFDERIVDADIYLDANYDMDIKTVLLGKFRVIRPDIFVLSDIGVVPDVSKAILLVKEIYGKVDGPTAWSAAVIIHAGITTDRAVPLRVTATYDYGYGLARCYSQYGTFSVFAGFFQGRVSTMRFDWYPYKDEYNTMIGPLIKLGCIFATELQKDTVWSYMSEDNMYVEKFSKLKSLRNGLIICDSIKLGKKILIKYVYDNDGAEGAIRKATEDISNYIVGRYPTNIIVTPTLYRTKRDIQLDTTSCDMVYQFPGMTKGWNYNITARRQAADAA
jgi:hypothetical protein